MIKVWHWDDPRSHAVKNTSDVREKRTFFQKAGDKSGIDGTVLSRAAITRNTRVVMDGTQASLRTEIRDPGEKHARLGTYCKPITPSGSNVYVADACDGTWVDNGFNRLAVWIKPPADLVRVESLTGADAKKPTTTFGTYIRQPTCAHPESEHDKISRQEGSTNISRVTSVYKNSGQGHFYNTFKLMMPGVWNQLIVDAHPDTRRESNSLEWDQDPLVVADGYENPGIEYPYAQYEGIDANSTGKRNYFDCLTEYYIDTFKLPGRQDMTSFPAMWYTSAIYAYADANAGDRVAIEKICSVGGAYDASRGELGISYKVRRKAAHGVDIEDRPYYDVEVKYSTSDIHALGWANATLAPHEGTVGFENPVPNPQSDYCHSHYITRALDMSVVFGREPLRTDFLYVGLKATDDDPANFRQIVIPMVDSALPPHLQGA